MATARYLAWAVVLHVNITGTRTNYYQWHLTGADYSSKHYSSIHEYGPASSQRHAVTRGPEDTQSCQIMLMPSNGRKTNNLYIEQGI